MKLKNKKADGLLVYCKEPEFFIQHIEGDQTFEVSQKLGSHLLSKYSDLLEVVEPKKKREKAED